MSLCLSLCFSLSLCVSLFLYLFLCCFGAPLFNHCVRRGTHTSYKCATATVLFDGAGSTWNLHLPYPFCADPDPIRWSARGIVLRNAVIVVEKKSCANKITFVGAKTPHRGGIIVASWIMFICQNAHKVARGALSPPALGLEACLWCKTGILTHHWV